MSDGGTQPTQQSCAYCEGPECVQWEDLPTTDQGQGICVWCGRAITAEWPAAQMPEGDDEISHYHFCTPYPTEGFPHGR